MPDKKITDAEIKKALEWCVSKFKNAGFVYLGVDGTKIVRTQEVLDLINRLQKENEGLQKLVNLSIDTQNDLTDKLLQSEENLKTAKAEAYKEFANELICRTHEISYNTMQVVNKDDIDNLLKELVGEDNV